VRRGVLLGERFRLEASVSGGGMGEVWRAVDLDHRQPVAVKTMARFEAADHQRFDREAALLQALNHPGIVRYVAHGLHGEVPYLVMEWLEGVTLAELVETRGVDAGEALSVARQTAEALAYAHGFGVVHRDVKPSNLILRAGDLAQLRLIDFGVARPVGASFALTRTGEAIGTPGYMAPEQVRGHKTLDARADVFALGCLLYEALTGRRPFEGTHPLAVHVKILKWDPPDVRQLAPEVTPEIAALVTAMLSKDPADRPHDGTAVAAALSRLTAPATSPRRSRPREAATRVDAAPPTRAIVVAAADPEAPPPAVPGAELCLDGAVVLVVEGGSPAELAARAAAAARALHRERPGAAIAVGLADQGDQAIDRVCDTAVRDALTLAPGQVRLDRAAAELLDPAALTWRDGEPYLT
jgi:eukaryotic-like serine/threonine-protein kinase